MDWQLFFVTLIVTFASATLLRRTWRTWSGRGSACGGCAGSSKRTASAQGTFIPVEQLTLRRRGGAS